MRQFIPVPQFPAAVLLILVWSLFSTPIAAARSIEDHDLFPEGHPMSLARNTASQAPKFPRNGLTLMGISGLVTIPTPAPIKRKEILLGAKFSTPAEAVFMLGTQTYRTEVNERFLQVSYAIARDTEISVSQVSSRRTTSPSIPSLDADDAPFSFGIRMNEDAEHPSWSLGAQYTPASDRTLARFDSDQLAQMRSIYATLGGSVARRGSMFLHFRTCFMPEQSVISPSGQVHPRQSENLLLIGLGTGWSLGRRLSLFGELLRLNYQGLLQKDDEVWQANAGMRFSFRGVNLECLARSLEGSPTIMTGLTATF